MPYKCARCETLGLLGVLFVIVPSPLALAGVCSRNVILLPILVPITILLPLILFVVRPALAIGVLRKLTMFIPRLGQCLGINAVCQAAPEVDDIIFVASIWFTAAVDIYRLVICRLSVDHRVEDLRSSGMAPTLLAVGMMFDQFEFELSVVIITWIFLPRLHVNRPSDSARPKVHDFL